MAELEDVLRVIPPGSRVLEIGAGTGEQSAALVRHGLDVSAIDVASSNYRVVRAFGVIDYDGRNIPFPDQTFDVVYSSNVLEHVVELDELQAEIRRVLKPAGHCVHLMPTPLWRVWTAITAFVSALQAGLVLLSAFAGRREAGERYWSAVWRAGRRLAGRIYEALLQPRHGERGNCLSELHYFSRGWWVRHFEANGFEIVEQSPGGLFYTGNMALGTRLSIRHRRQIAPWLGSACHFFVVRSSC